MMIIIIMLSSKEWDGWRQLNSHADWFYMVIFLAFDRNKARLSPHGGEVWLLLLLLLPSFPRNANPYAVVVKLTHNASANTLYNIPDDCWPRFPEVIDTFFYPNPKAKHTRCTWIAIASASTYVHISLHAGPRIVNNINLVSSCQHLRTILLIT